MSLPEASVRVAAAVAERLAPEGISALYCSPLERTRETAAPIAARLGLEPQVREEAIEVDYGEWTNRTIDELRPLDLWQRYNAARSITRIPNGETVVEVQARMVNLLEELRLVHSNDRIALVSHGDPIRTAIAFYLGVPLDLLQRLEVSPGSISVLEFSDWGARLIRLNEVIAA